MKTVQNLFSFLSKPICTILLLSAVLSSCSSDGDPSDLGQDDFIISATVDGITVMGANAGVSVFSETADFFTIIGGDEHAFQFALDGPATENTFTTGPGKTLRLSYSQSNPLATWGASEADGSGSITITEITDEYIQGSFSFTGFNPADNSTKEITAGEFRARKL